MKEKIPDDPAGGAGFIFQKQVTGGFQNMARRFGKSADPFVEKRIIEDEILFPPDNAKRDAGQSKQIVINSFDCVICCVMNTQRDILDKLLDGDAVSGGVVRQSIVFADIRG